MPPRPRPPVDRFREKVVPLADGCHRWIGFTLKLSGYGGLSVPVGGRSVMLYAHRFAYELANGPIPPGHQIHHVCEHPWCVNPDHLVLATLDAHNALHRKRWAVNKAKTHCVNGHAFTADNTYRAPRGGRQCRTCLRARARAYRRRHR